MKIINRIIEAEMTASEQVELMRLEDEVSQARDEWEEAVDNQFDYSESEAVLSRTINNLNNYIDSITKIVMDRITNAQCDGLEEEWYRVKQGL